MINWKQIGEEIQDKIGWNRFQSLDKAKMRQLISRLLRVLNDADHPLTISEIRRKMGLHYRSRPEEEKDEFVFVGVLFYLGFLTKVGAIKKVKEPRPPKLKLIPQLPIEKYELNELFLGRIQFAKEEEDNS